MASSSDEYRSFLVNYGGGYLRNALWASDSTCNYCAGIPSNPDFPSCYPCEHSYPGNPETSDRRGFVSYGWNNSQSATVMYGYKEPHPQPQARRVVTLMLWYSIARHLSCASCDTHGDPSMWATVPSLRQRAHPQQLHEIASRVLRNMPEARMSASTDIRDPRSLRPENFIVQSNVAGSHVLLVDDTWTSGAHAESACAALKRAGAACVSILVLARWLDLKRGVSAEFIRNELTDDFNPDRCPFGEECP